jgi:mannose-6-phosphate isomerase-like protein (cupin superfamily)
VVPPTALRLENRHTGERLALWRVRRGDQIWLRLAGSLPPRSEGPPLHVHVAEDEEGWVRAGTLSAVVDGLPLTVGSGGSTRIPRGTVHRWWNAGDEPLEFDGYARPVADLDRYLQAMFEVMNASRAGRPSLVYMAHVSRRHRRTQAVRIMPGPLQAVVFGVAVALGTLLGRYRGTDWPGCPDRCAGAPLVPDDADAPIP